eukprot:997434-Pelagomonas_calceolata.AAC.1
MREGHTDQQRCNVFDVVVMKMACPLPWWDTTREACAGNKQTRMSQPPTADGLIRGQCLSRTAPPMRACKKTTDANA